MMTTSTGLIRGSAKVWRVGPDCKLGAVRPNRFESCLPHNSSLRKNIFLPMAIGTGIKIFCPSVMQERSAEKTNGQRPDEGIKSPVVLWRLASQYAA